MEQPHNFHKNYLYSTQYIIVHNETEFFTSYISQWIDLINVNKLLHNTNDTSHHILNDLQHPTLNNLSHHVLDKVDNNT